MHTKTIAELAAGLQAKEFSSVELAQAFLQRIKQFDPEINSFISVTEEHALQAAKAADEKIANGQATSLTGIPIGHKDLLCTKGIKTSCGSKMLDNFIAPYDATVVQHAQDAGMVMLGKVNMDEFAMGSSNENSYAGPVKNPWNLEYVPGGSSGGSAAAIAARLVPGTTGSDTGGSIRQPAAFCGITGLKPTYGRVSRYGMIAFASSLDQVGPMASSAEDAAMLLNALAGYDPQDSTSADHPVPDYTADLHRPIEGLRIGLPKEYFAEGLAPEVEQAIQAAIKTYEQMGAQVKEISLPSTELAIPTYYVVAPAECSSNLSRFDGVRYGYRCENPGDMNDLYERSRAEGFGAEVKRRILIGTYTLSSSSYTAYYLRAQRIRRLIKNEFMSAFADVDVILTPATPTTAFKVGAKSQDPVQMYLSDIYTVAVNLAGLPAIAFPVGQANGLPVGMQLIGNYFAEAGLLNAAHQYQQATDWHRRIPAAFSA